jgi:hypothetical protein
VIPIIPTFAPSKKHGRILSVDPGKLTRTNAVRLEYEFYFTQSPQICNKNKSARFCCRALVGIRRVISLCMR